MVSSRREYMFQYCWISYIPYLKAYGCIRANFVHDWASIPNFMSSISHPDGVMAPFSGFHDHGYRCGGLYLARDKGDPFVFTPMSRDELDMAFREHNMWHNDLPLIHYPAHRILRLFGWANFKPRDITKIDWSKPVLSSTGM
jgi:hypothetical protein